MEQIHDSFGSTLPGRKFTQLAALIHLLMVAILKYLYHTQVHVFVVWNVANRNSRLEMSLNLCTWRHFFPHTTCAYIHTYMYTHVFWTRCRGWQKTAAVLATVQRDSVCLPDLECRESYIDLLDIEIIIIVNLSSLPREGWVYRRWSWLNREELHEVSCALTNVHLQWKWARRGKVGPYL